MIPFSALYDWLIKGGTWVYGFAFVLWGFVSPIHTLIFCSVIAIGIDFITGNMASYKSAKINNKRYNLLSEKIWKTIWKFSFTVVGIGFAWMLDIHVLPFSVALPNVFASLVIGAEFKSFLENASIITGWKVFLYADKEIRNTIKDKTKIDIKDEE